MKSFPHLRWSAQKLHFDGGTGTRLLDIALGKLNASLLFMRQTFSIKKPEIPENFSLCSLLGESHAGSYQFRELGEQSEFATPKGKPGWAELK